MIQSKYIKFVLLQVGIVMVTLGLYDVLTLFGYIIMIMSHEFGHYIFALIDGGTPKFGIDDGGNPCVVCEYMSVTTGLGGLMVNLLLMPLFFWLYNMAWWSVIMLIFALAFKDIVMSFDIFRGSDK